MKRRIIRAIVLIIVFIGTIFVAGKVMNQGHENITMEMARATFPMMEILEGDTAYNLLHAYAQPMEIAYQHETLTMLGASRELSFRIYPYGRSVTGVTYTVRNIDDGRLIEQAQAPGLGSEIVSGERLVTGELALKDLLEPGVEYSLALAVRLGEEDEVYFYTRVLWESGTHFDEKLEYVRDFHERLFDKEKAASLTMYLESNAARNDNSTFAYVNIYSSFQQITYGDLAPRQVGDTEIQLTSYSGAVSTYLVHSIVTTGKGEGTVHYEVEEYFRIRYGTERIYLLGYERTMQQLPDLEKMAVNDKLILGISDEEIQMGESEDGSTVAFVAAGELFCYNAPAGKLVRCFGFTDGDYADPRTRYNAHGIKILDVDEGGNVDFAVYGYMNRGRHEGEVGIEFYHFGSDYNTIEEIVYIPYGKSYEILEAEIDRLLYLNREQHLYLTLENKVYCVDLAARTYEEAWSEQGLSRSFAQDDTVRVSEDHRLIVASGRVGEHPYDNQLRVINLKTEKSIQVGADRKEDIAVRFLGFIGEDLVYGLAREEDITEESTGRLFFPMYRIIICDETGKILKDYEPSGYYVTDAVISGDQIRLERVAIDGSGRRSEVSADYIATSIAQNTGKNLLSVASIETYERYVQIQVPNTIKTKSLKLISPKEVVYEGGRELAALEGVQSETERYFVYSGYGLEGIYNTAANAIREADGDAGAVVSENGLVLWKKETRSSRNQILSITAESVAEDKRSIAVCLEAMLKYEGVTRNADLFLEQGQAAIEILLEALEDKIVLELSGCTLDQMFYYLNRDLPVLVLLDDGGAVLLTGYNESQVLYLDPGKSELVRMPISEASAWFEQSGNPFVTYINRGAE